MLGLLPMEHSEVLLSSSDQVLLNVKIEIVEVVLFRVNEFTLVHDEIIFVVEKLFTFMVDVILQLFVTEGSVIINIIDFPVLVKAVEDEDHDDHS